MKKFAKKLYRKSKSLKKVITPDSLLDDESKADKIKTCELNDIKRSFHESEHELTEDSFDAYFKKHGTDTGSIDLLCEYYQSLRDYDGLEKKLYSLSKLIPNDKTKETVEQEDLVDWLNISHARANNSVEKRLNNIDEYKKLIKNYKKTTKEKKVVIFGAISGNYDSLKLPAKPNNKYDYVLFSDSPIKAPDFIQVRPMPYLDSEQTRRARYIKTNPHKLLPEYDIAVWVDANILILDDLHDYIDKVLKEGNKLGAFRHPRRKNIMDEFDSCIEASKDSDELIILQKEYYEKLGYNSDELIESNVLVFDLRDDTLSPYLNDWWNQIDRFSKRDQLSFNYCLDKNNISWTKTTERPNTARNSAFLALTKHGKDEASNDKLIDKLSPSYIKPLNPENYSKVKDYKVLDVSIEVVVCVYNALEDTKKCLESVKRHRDPNMSLIIIDDGSDKETKDFLLNFHTKNIKWSTLHREDSPSGYTKAANRGLKASSADVVILLNSDTIVTSKWTRKITDVMFSNMGTGIVGPLSSAASAQSVPDHKNLKNQTAINNLPEGIKPEDINSFCEENYRKELTPRVPLVHGFCFAIKRDVIDEIGYLDEENFPRGYGEENDYCFRASNAGFTLMIATNTYIYHSKSKSYIGPEREKLMKNGSQAFKTKHGQHRISRAIDTMDNNPLLVDLRNRVEKKFY